MLQLLARAAVERAGTPVGLWLEVEELLGGA